MGNNRSASILFAISVVCCLDLIWWKLHLQSVGWSCLVNFTSLELSLYGVLVFVELVFGLYLTASCV